MKALVVFAALIFFLPVHRQEKAAHPNGQSQNTQDITKTFGDSITVPVINQQTSAEDKQRSQNESQGYFRSLISANNLPNIGLFFVGIGGIVTAVCTLRKIERQTAATEISAKATLANTQAVMNTERGFVLIDWDDLTCFDEPPKPIEEWRPSFVWTARNTGKSPVFLIEYAAVLQLINSMDDLPDVPIYSTAVPCRDEPVTPDKKSDPFFTTLKTDIPYLSIETLYRQEKKVLFVYGYVRYLDIFKREHFTKFGLKYECRSVPTIDYDRFCIGGPDKYNEYT